MALLCNLCLIDCPPALSHFVYRHFYINGFYGRGNNIDKLLTGPPQIPCCFMFLEQCDEKYLLTNTTLKTVSTTTGGPLHFSWSDWIIMFEFQIHATDKQCKKWPFCETNALWPIDLPHNFPVVYKYLPRVMHGQRKISKEQFPQSSFKLRQMEGEWSPGHWINKPQRDVPTDAHYWEHPKWNLWWIKFQHCVELNMQIFFLSNYA